MPFVHSQFRLKGGFLDSERPALFASKKEICMFILTKSFTNKKGEMFLKIFPRQYPSIETAHAAMQSDYQEELKKRHLDRSDEEAILSSYYIDTTEAAIYKCQDYAPNWLTVSVLYAINEVV